MTTWYPTERSIDGDGSDYVIVGPALAERVMMSWAVAGGWIAVGCPLDRYQVARMLGHDGPYDDGAPRWLSATDTFFLALRPAGVVRPTKGAYQIIAARIADQWITAEEARLTAVFGHGAALVDGPP